MLVIALLDKVEHVQAFLPCHGSLPVCGILGARPFKKDGAMLLHRRMKTSEKSAGLGYISIFIEGSVEIIGGCLQVHGVAAEVASSMPWVVVPTRPTAADKVENRGGNCTRVAGRSNAAAPHLVPGWIKLSPKKRRSRMRLADCSNALWRNREAIGGFDGSLCAAFAGGRGDTGEADLSAEFNDPAQVLLPILAVALRDIAVLIFNLNQNDWSAVRCKARSDDFGKPSEILLDTRRVGAVHGADRDAGFVAQVRRVTAVVPLRTDIGADAEKNRKLMLLAKIQK